MTSVNRWPPSIKQVATERSRVARMASVCDKSATRPLWPSTEIPIPSTGNSISKDGRPSPRRDVLLQPTMSSMRKKSWILYFLQNRMTVASCSRISTENRIVDILFPLHHQSWRRSRRNCQKDGRSIKVIKRNSNQRFQLFSLQTHKDSPTTGTWTVARFKDSHHHQ